MVWNISQDECTNKNCLRVDVIDCKSHLQISQMFSGMIGDQAGKYSKICVIKFIPK